MCNANISQPLSCIGLTLIRSAKSTLTLYFCFGLVLIRLYIGLKDKYLEQFQCTEQIFVKKGSCVNHYLKTYDFLLYQIRGLTTNQLRKILLLEHESVPLLLFLTICIIIFNVKGE